MWHTGDWFLHHDGASTHCFVLQEVWPDTAWLLAPTLCIIPHI
jgi:hypothetical protein